MAKGFTLYMVKAVMSGRADEIIDLAQQSVALEHDPEKWTPVFGQDHAQTNNLDRDPIRSNWITV